MGGRVSGGSWGWIWWVQVLGGYALGVHGNKICGGDDGNCLRLHRPGIGRPKNVLVGSVHYCPVAAGGGWRPILVGFVGAHSMVLLPKAGNMATLEHVNAMGNASVHRFGLVALGGPN